MEECEDAIYIATIIFWDVAQLAKKVPRCQVTAKKMSVLETGVTIGSWAAVTSSTLFELWEECFASGISFITVILKMAMNVAALGLV
jgi:predicted membrane protein